MRPAEEGLLLLCCALGTQDVFLFKSYSLLIDFIEKLS